MAMKWDKEQKKMVPTAGRGRPRDAAVTAKLESVVGRKAKGTFTVPVAIGSDGPDVTRAKVLSYCQRVAGKKVKVTGFSYPNEKSATFTLS